jgi:hypothetical protein
MPQKFNRNIKYTDRDFSTLKNTLIDYSKTYFPDTYNDFSNSSTGMLFIEMTAYVGDVLSFYLDNQIQETFIQYAQEDESLFNLAYMLGYKPKITTAATVDIDFFQQVPSITFTETSSGLLATKPDFNYALKIGSGTQISSQEDSSLKFLIEDEVDFSISSSLDTTTVSVYSLIGVTPNYYLLKKTRKAQSATINTITFSFSSPKKFDVKKLIGSNIIGILDIYDSNGNRWYEVDNLAQEMIMDTINISSPFSGNPNIVTDLDVTHILKLRKIQRRFATKFINSTTLEIQFGAGSATDNDEEIIPNPDNVGTGLPFSKDRLTTAYSPFNFQFTNTYGIAPSNTNLIVRYLTGGGLKSNVNSGVLTQMDTNNVRFINRDLNNNQAQTIFNSVASNNALAADGGQDADTVEEIRQNALGNFQNQLRTVTQQDYLIRALSMPPNLGTVAKVHIEPTKIGEYQAGELASVLDMYVLSYNSSKKIRKASSTLKQNLKTYLSEYRMIGDSIKIKDSYWVNIGINFDIIVLPNFNNNSVLTNCIAELDKYFNIDNWLINQPIILKDLSILLDKVEGVQTVIGVKVRNLSGESLGYSPYAYDIAGATINGVIYPSVDPMVFEVKDPTTDIIGRVVPL